MVLLSSSVYKETKKILSGKLKKSPLLTDLCEWFEQEFGLKIINFDFDKLKHTKNTYRVKIIFHNSNYYNKMYLSPFIKNEEYNDLISAKFRELALKYNFTKKSKLAKLFVAYYDFSHEAKTEANYKTFDKTNKSIKEKFPEVWHIVEEFESSVVFYYTDNDILKYAENGISSKIKSEYYSVLKTYDEFDYFTSSDVILEFDSKENLDKNYNGNLFYYSRG
jgi:hypothetical protein